MVGVVPVDPDGHGSFLVGSRLRMPSALIDFDGHTARFVVEDGRVVCVDGPDRARDTARLVTRAVQLLDPNDPAHLAAVVEAVANGRVVADDAVLVSLAGHPNADVRAAVADCGFASPDVLSELAGDDTEQVRVAVEAAYAAEVTFREARWMLGVPVVLFVLVAVVLIGLLVALFSMR